MELLNVESREAALPLSALRLVVPPLRLMSAFLWQVVQRRNVTQYGKLEQFVVLVTETVPDIMSRSLVNKLIFHLRKKVILELCLKDKMPDLWIIQAHLDSLRNLTHKCKDVESEIINNKFIRLVHSILEDAEKKENFIQHVFPVEYGSGYDAVLQSLAWEFLSRVEDLLPVPSLKETASRLCGGLSMMEEIVQPLSDPAEIKDVLQHFKTKRLHARNNEQSQRVISEMSIPSSAEVVCLPHSIAQETVSSAITIEHEETLPPTSIAQETIIIESEGTENLSESDHAAIAIMSPSQSYTEEAEPLADSEEFTAIAGTEEAEEGLQQEEVLCEEKDSGVCEVQQIYLTTDGSTVVVSEFENEGEEATQLQFLEQSEMVETSGVRQVSLEQWISELTGKGISLPVLPPTPVEIVREETIYVPVIERPPSVKSIIHRKSSPPRATVSKKAAATLSESQTTQEEKRHSCPECHKEFRFECLLRSHMRTHTGERPFQCSDCGKSFRCLSFLTNHIKTHSLTRPFKCMQCIKTFRKKADLIKHIRVHTGEKPYKCTICGKSFSQGSYLKIHRECHTSENLHQCPHCDKSFPTAFKLSIHVRYHSMERSYQCNQCGKSFIYASLLRRHKGYHAGERQYLCSICGKSFVYMFDLKKHQRNHERPRLKIPCTLCNKTFAGPEMLRCHLRIHTGERPFRCKICGKAFSQIGNMKRHERVHTGERPFSCERCGKTYKHSSHLKNHMLSHTGERPWQCSHCGRSFKFAGPLKKHERTHLGERGNRRRTYDQTRSRMKPEPKSP
ncbi:zinc finger and SCAN domain-containing protein 12-like [Sinocyclocheilus anshuiensis]|uniref:zinc finger and SCAN domain-containing protein 12-like n=1 Tax=Sinocyclocheilus anshuiensis TaxID=1608454 RepID=UPI0007BACA95|nr:PREDICTED: zinc finger and SCAN domain-containing protein 12-like [Sinocyclocheilus anshuiensis]